MAFDDDLAHRVRALLADETDVTEKRMFGGLAFLVAGKMSVAVSGRGGLMVRVDPEEIDAVLDLPHAGELEMRGRPTEGWVRVGVEGLESDEELAPWVRRGLTRARALAG